MELTDKQLKFIDAYLTSKNIKEVCNKLKISRSNVYQQYLCEPAIKEEINRRRNEILNDTTMFLQDKLLECSQVLMEIVNDLTTAPQVKINAINCIFNNYNKLVETTDILNRLEELEQRILNQEDK